MINLSKAYVGVDVSKDTLDIHVYPLGINFKIENNKESINGLIKKMNQYEVIQVACEATGGYEKLLSKLLIKKNFNVWVVDPRRIKGFIIASGQKSKTDKIDAQKIAEFASKNIKQYESIGKTENQENLQSLVNRKNDLTQFLATEKTRLKHPAHQFSSVSIKKFIKILEKEIKSIEKQVNELIQGDDILNRKSKILESIPGIGKSTSATLLSFVPELGKISNKQVSSLIGVCPYDRQSGKYTGKKYVMGGRAIPRKALYMCALTTIKYSLVLKGFYDRLIANNKPFKVAMVAIIHKLIVVANSLLKKNELWRSLNAEA
jgi:transposase